MPRVWVDDIDPTSHAISPTTAATHGVGSFREVIPILVWLPITTAPTLRHRGLALVKAILRGKCGLKGG